MNDWIYRGELNMCEEGIGRLATGLSMNGDAAKPSLTQTLTGVPRAKERKSCEDDKHEVEVQVYSHCKARLR